MSAHPYRASATRPREPWWRRALCWLGVGHDVWRWNYVPPHFFWGRCHRCGREVFQ